MDTVGMFAHRKCAASCLGLAMFAFWLALMGRWMNRALTFYITSKICG